MLHHLILKMACFRLAEVESADVLKHRVWSDGKTRHEPHLLTGHDARG